MKKSARKFFWMMAISGALMILQAFGRPFIMKHLGLDGDSLSSIQNEFSRENMTPPFGPSSLEKIPPPPDSMMGRAIKKGLQVVQKGLDHVCKNCDVTAYDSEEEEVSSYQWGSSITHRPQQGKVSGKPSVTVRHREQKKKGLVYKDGQYYQAVDSNVYFDKNGTPTLVIDQGQNRYGDQDQKGRQALHPSEVSVKSSPKMARTAETGDGTLVDRGIASQGSAYSPGGMKDMVETLKNARKSMKERNQVLKQLAQ
jgi:hypothetical protein